MSITIVFWNEAEKRIRTGWRMLIQFVLFMALVIVFVIFDHLFLGSLPKSALGGKDSILYPLEMLHQQKRAVIDELDDRRILVYIDPISNITAAVYTNAHQYAWHNDELKLDNGEFFRGGKLCNAQGVTQTLAYPMQIFTRWYGFSLTFPGCQLYQT